MPRLLEVCFEIRFTLAHLTQPCKVDLAPTPVDMEALPSNCTFDIDDINPGLPHYESQFDLIHCRIIGAGLRDCQKSKLDVEACLKPGGVLIWMDVDYDLIEENMENFVERACDTREGGSWPARMLYGEQTLPFQKRFPELF
jgi:hypothetical protein